jgi:hypothetical protein
MRSEQLAELVRRHTDSLQDAAHGAREQVFTAVDWHDGSTPVRVAHHVMAAVNPRDDEVGALECLDDLGSRHSWDVARHKATSYQESGYVECQSQLIRWSDFFKKQLQASAQVRDCFLPCGPFAECGDIGAQMGGCVPAAAVLVLLDDVGHVNDTSHNIDYRTMSCNQRS